jgi:hypothetical protein
LLFRNYRTPSQQNPTCFIKVEEEGSRKRQNGIVVCGGEANTASHSRNHTSMLFKPRTVVSHHADAVLLGQILGHRSKATANVQTPHSRFQLEFARDEIHLVNLRLFQIIIIFNVFPIGTGIVHAVDG